MPNNKKIKKVKRIAINIERSYKGPIEGFVVNFVNKNYWRVSGYIEREDLFQEAHLLYLKVCEAYPTVDNGRWFFSLYKTSFLNYFNGISNKKTERFLNEIIMEEDISDIDIESIDARVSHNEGWLSVLIDGAPEEVRAVLSLLAAAPSELLEEVAVAWRTQGKRKVVGSRHLGDLLGYDPDQVDLVQTVKDYFLNQ